MSSVLCVHTWVNTGITVLGTTGIALQYETGITVLGATGIALQLGTPCSVFHFKRAMLYIHN